MIKHIIGFSARHPLSVISALGGLVLLGIAGVFVIPLDFLPLMRERFLIVSAEYPGVTAEETRNLVTVPLEDAFASLGGLKSLSSVSREGLSLLRIELHWGTDTDLALAESREIIDICYESLPSYCSKPKVSRESGNGEDSITIVLIPMDGDLRYGRYIAETDIKPRLQRLNGVALITVSGGEEEEIGVNFEKAGLESRGLDLAAAADLIAASNFEYPGGTIREGEREYTVKTLGLYRNLEELKNTPLSWDQGSLLRVGDIAEVERTSGPQSSFFLYRSEEGGIPRGMECIRIGVRKGRDSPPLPLSMRVKKEIEILSTLYSPWYHFEITGDLSEQIVESLRSLLFSALAAVFSAGLVVFIFLRSVKLSLVITGIIPLSALASILTLGISGRSLNLISLSGIAIGIGMVVDAGVVAIEQIDGELKNPGLKNRTELNKDWPEPVIRGTNAVALSSGASALSTVIVFIPVFFIPGILGELFGDMAAAVISSISFSCLLSFTYVPAMTSLIKPESRSDTAGTSGLLHRLSNRYRRCLRFLFRNPWSALIPLGLCIAAGAFSLGFSNFTLLGELKGDSISFEVEFPPGTSLEKMRRVAMELSRGMEGMGEIRALEISGGLEEDDYPRLAKPGERLEKIKFTGRLRGRNSAVRARIADRFRGSPYTPVFNGNQDLLARSLEIGGMENLIRSDSPGDALARAEALLAELPSEGHTVPGGPPYPDSPPRNFIPRVIRSDLAFVPDRLSLARFSLSAQYVARTARDVLEGIRESYYEEGREIPLVIRLRKEDLKSPEDLGNTMIHVESGPIPLRFLGALGEEEGETVLYRYNRGDAKIFAFPLPRELETKYSVVSPGREEITEMIRTGLVLLAVTIVLLYLSMGAQFESFLVPLILLLAIPPSFAGAFFLLLITGVRPDINSLIALVVLFGISINNSIILYESCRAPEGAASRGRRISFIIENCVKKLRALLITNITTLIALVPFAIDPFGVNSQASLSIALIGGLIFSLILVLLIVPLCFSFTGGKNEPRD
jgi:multidrug efflux pump subunit AcrB